MPGVEDLVIREAPAEPGSIGPLKMSTIAPVARFLVVSWITWRVTGAGPLPPGPPPPG
jgi:hypothetical protein